jgi:RecG-like helicase
MKRITTTLVASALAMLLLASVSTAFAAKEITITGEGKCAKCALKESDKCQNVIQVEKDGKTTSYYLAQNDVSKDFHENICKESKKVTATGTAKKVDGKMEFTATKIEVAK